MKFKNHYNANQFADPGEKISPLSQTIPDQSLTVKQILERHSRGLAVNIRQPIYLGDQMDFPDPKRLDLSEMEDIMHENQERMLSLHKKMEDAKTEKQRNKIRQQIEAETKKAAEDAAKNNNDQK